MYNLLDDISVLTSVKRSTLSKMSSVAEYCICDYINDLSILDEDVVSIDLDFGKLLIMVVNDTISYKFVPSDKLEKNILSTIMDSKNPLELAVSDSLQRKIESTYKDII